MSTTQLRGVLRHYRRVLGSRAGITDGELLEAFITQRDEASFEVLVQRHGPMVWACRRMLHNYADAEDAFQAVFLVFLAQGQVHTTARKGWQMALRRRSSNGP